MQTIEIQSWIDKLSQDEAEECLDSLRALACQLDSAMDSIVKRQLPALKSGLHLQRVSCASLAAIRHRSNQRPERKSETLMADHDLATEIKSATESLLVLNRRYAALLKHSGDTLQLLAGLYRSYRGSVQPGSPISGSLQTWSCEV